MSEAGFFRIIGGFSGWGSRTGGAGGLGEGMGVGVGSCGGRCLKQDLQDFWGFSGWGSRTGGAGGLGEGMGVGVGSWGVRCLKQDLRDFLGIFGMGDALEEQCVGMGRGRVWLRRALSEAGFAGFFGDFRDGGRALEEWMVGLVGGRGWLRRALSEAGFAGFFGDFRDGDAHWRSGWSGWSVAVGGCGGRCLKQDLQGFWGFSDGGRARD